MTITVQDLPVPTTTVRVDHAQDLLAFLPYQLGFRPRDSVVAVSLQGTARRLGLVARVDLADLVRPLGAELADSVAGHLSTDGATSALLVVYTHTDPRVADRGLCADLAAPAVRAAETARRACARLGEVVVWVVCDDGYLDLDCREPACCPPGGRPLVELIRAEDAARELGGYGPVPESRGEIGHVEPAGSGPRRSASAARSRWADAWLRTSRAAEVLAWRRRSLDTWRTAMATLLTDRVDNGDDVPCVGPAPLGRIEAALDDPAVRDAVLLTFVDPASDLPDHVLRTVPDGLAERWASWTDPDDPGTEVGEPAPIRSPLEAIGGEVIGAAVGAHRIGWQPHAPDDEPAGDEAVGSQPTGHEPAAPEPADRDEPSAADVSARLRAALEELVEPRCGRAPQPEVLAAGRTLLTRVVAHGRSDRQAPALTLLALLAWWSGEGARASVLVDRALCHDPGYRLGGILAGAVAGGLPPGWARRRC